jgi:DNA-binding MarR family transcriptional regulator
MYPRNQAEDITRFKDEEYEEWKFADKWSIEIEEQGYTQIPNLLIHCYKQLKLTPTEFLVLVNLESYRWYDNRLPNPTVQTQGERLGISPRNITRTITALEKKGLIKRIKRKNTSNMYSVKCLVEKLDKLAKIVSSSGHNLSKQADNVVPVEATVLSSKEDELNNTKLSNTKQKKIPDTSIFSDEEITWLMNYTGSN